VIRIPAVLFPERVSILFFSELVLSFVCFLAAAALTGGTLEFGEGVLTRITVAAFSVVFGCYLNGLYRNLHWRSRIFLTLHLCSVFGIALLIQGVVAYAGIGLELPRGAMLAGAALNFALMVMWRISYTALLNRVFASERVLFLGASDITREIAAGMTERPELGYTVVGFLTDDRKPGDWIDGAEVVGALNSLAECSRRLRAKTLVVDDQEIRSRLPVATLTWAKRQGMTIHDAGTAFEMICRRVCSRTFRPSQIIFANEIAQRPNSLALQSIYTNLVALVAYVLTLPVLALAALAIRVSSSGPAFVTEQYAGFNGIPFSASRLRCTAEDDPARATRVGALIRAMHLEFLPRVINLVRGEMALVGPEPQRVEFAEALSNLIPFYRQRQLVKPGITGWTQIQDAPGSVTDALRDIEYDLYYTKHFSLPLDAYILLYAIRAILPFQDRQ
jgi:lipopolysaccharide/colanic/teichoic acid biosynthesis glycosyltransferase